MVASQDQEVQNLTHYLIKGTEVKTFAKTNGKN